MQVSIALTRVDHLRQAGGDIQGEVGGISAHRLPHSIIDPIVDGLNDVVISGGGGNEAVGGIPGVGQVSVVSRLALFTKNARIHGRFFERCLLFPPEFIKAIESH